MAPNTNNNSGAIRKKDNSKKQPAKTEDLSGPHKKICGSAAMKFFNPKIVQCLLCAEDFTCRNRDCFQEHLVKEHQLRLKQYENNFLEMEDDESLFERPILRCPLCEISLLGGYDNVDAHASLHGTNAEEFYHNHVVFSSSNHVDNKHVGFINSIHVNNNEISSNKNHVGKKHVVLSNSNHEHVVLSNSHVANERHVGFSSSDEDENTDEGCFEQQNFEPDENGNFIPYSGLSTNEIVGFLDSYATVTLRDEYARGI